MFWSTKNPKMKCLYQCEIIIKGKKQDKAAKIEQIKETGMKNMTYCHNMQEWAQLLKRTECLCDLKKLEAGSGGVKRKLYPKYCIQCLRNQRFEFLENQSTANKLVNALHKSIKRQNNDKDKAPDKTKKKQTTARGGGKKTKKMMAIGSTNPDLLQQISRASVTTTTHSSKHVVVIPQASVNVTPSTSDNNLTVSIISPLSSPKKPTIIKPVSTKPINGLCNNIPTKYSLPNNTKVPLSFHSAARNELNVHPSAFALQATSHAKIKSPNTHDGSSMSGPTYMKATTSTISKNPSSSKHIVPTVFRSTIASIPPPNSKTQKFPHMSTLLTSPITQSHVLQTIQRNHLPRLCNPTAVSSVQYQNLSMRQIPLQTPLNGVVGNVFIGKSLESTHTKIPTLTSISQQPQLGQPASMVVPQLQQSTVLFPLSFTKASPRKDSAQTHQNPQQSPLLKKGSCIKDNVLQHAARLMDLVKEGGSPSKKAKKQLILPKTVSYTPELSFSQNPMYVHQPCLPTITGAPINTFGHAPSTAGHKKSNPGNDFKKELLLIQVKEYLRKHPNAVDYSKTPVAGQGPVVYLSDGQSVAYQNPITFRAMLPEHLWKDLISAGIAQTEIEKIVLDSCVKQEDQKSKNIQPARLLSVAPQSTVFKSRCINTPTVTVSTFGQSQNIQSLNTSIRSLQQLKKHQLTQQQQQIPQHLQQSHQPHQQLQQLQQLQQHQQQQLQQLHQHLQQSQQQEKHLPQQLQQQQPQHTPLHIDSNQTTQIIQKLYNNILDTKALSRCASIVTLPHMLPPPLLGPPKQQTTMNLLAANQIVNLIQAKKGFSNLMQQQHSKGMFSSKHLVNSSPVRVLSSAATSTTTTTTTINIAQPSTSTVTTISQQCSPAKRKKRIKMSSQSEDESSPQKKLSASNCQTSERELVASSKNSRSIPPLRTNTGEVCLDTEIDFCDVDMNFVGDEFVERRLIEVIGEEEVETKTKTHIKQRRNYCQMLKTFLEEENRRLSLENETQLNFTIKTDDGFRMECNSLQGLFSLFRRLF